MSAISQPTTSGSQMRTYQRAKSVVFLKTQEAFGGLSNMAGGYPLTVSGIRIYSAEALYQACRFPHLPDVQRLIIGQHSPMTAKMVGKPHRHNSRPDWDLVRVNVMRWSLRVKLLQNWERFGTLLLETNDRPIVEESRRDAFWGAKPNLEQDTLIGINALGRLLMELREQLRSNPEELQILLPLAIPDFVFLSEPIPIIQRLNHNTQPHQNQAKQDSFFL